MECEMADPNRSGPWWIRHPAVRIALLALTFGFIAWALAGQLDELKHSAAQLNVEWKWIALATVIVLATYAVLIESWRMLLAGWGGELSFGQAVRIWTIANLGRWIPGKVWSVGALGILASEAGVPGAAASGAAILGTALNLGAGFAVIAVLGPNALETVQPGSSVAAIVLAIGAVSAIIALPWIMPPVLNRLARWRKAAPVGSHIKARTLWLVTAINASSWILYGFAFLAFSKAVTPSISGTSASFITVYCASYLIGYLVLFSPGGLGFREIALVAFLVGMGMSNQGDAVILSVTSRLWITVLEILPGVLSLLFLSSSQRSRLRH